MSFVRKNLSWSNKSILVLSFFTYLSTQAQVKLRLEPGALINTASDNIGIILNVEPKLNIKENMVIGIRFGIATNSQEFSIRDRSLFSIDEKNDNAVFSIIPTLDYYINDNYYRPYIGAGIGYYFLSTIDIRETENNEIQEGTMNNQLGLLLRAGIEVGNTRLGLEYNLIPNAAIEVSSNREIGSVKNSYLGVSIGFIL